MTTAKNRICLGLLVFALAMATSPGFGEGNQDQAAWDSLRQLTIGQPVRVVQKDTKSISGKFVRVTDEAFVLGTAAGEETFSRQSIQRISSKGQGHRKRNTLIGAGIGAGAGAVIGAATGGPRPCTGFCFGPTFSRGEVAGVLAVVGAAVGAIIGAVIPTGGWHDVYRAS